MCSNEINDSTLRNTESFDFETKNSYSITVTTRDSDDLTFTKNFIINVIDEDEEPTAIPEQNQINKIALYPNPTSNALKIRGLDYFTDLEIQFVTIKGQVVKKYRSTQNNYDVSNLATGTYIAIIRSEGKIIKTINFYIRH